MWLSSTHFGRSLHQPLASASFRAEYSGCSLIIESDAERCCGRDRCHSGGFLLRIMPPSWYPVPACVRHGHSAGGPFSTAMTIVLHRFASLALKSRIDARKRVKTGKNLHRFPSLGLKSRIDAGCSPFLSTRSTTRSCTLLHRAASEVAAKAGADAPGGGISLSFCRRGCAAPAYNAATLNASPLQSFYLLPSLSR